MIMTIDKKNSPEARQEKLGILLAEGLQDTSTGECFSNEDLAALADGAVTGLKRDRMLKHAASCSSCYEVFQLIGEISNDTEAVEIVEEGAAEEGEIVPMPMEGPEKKKRTYFKPLALAASLLIVMLSVYIFYRGGDIPKNMDEMAMKNEIMDAMDMKERELKKHRAKMEKVSGVNGELPAPKSPAPGTRVEKKKNEPPLTSVGFAAKKKGGREIKGGGKRSFDDEAAKKAPSKAAPSYKFSRSKSKKSAKKSAEESSKVAMPTPIELEESNKKYTPPKTLKASKASKRMSRSNEQRVEQRAEQKAVPKPRVRQEKQQVQRELDRDDFQAAQKPVNVDGVSPQVRQQTSVPAVRQKTAKFGKDKAGKPMVPVSGIVKRADAVNSVFRSSSTYMSRSRLRGLFRESVSVSIQLKKELDKLRTEVAGTGDASKLSAYIKRVSPAVTIEISRGTLRVYPNISYFLSRSTPGSAEYRFFALARSGWCDTAGNSYNIGKGDKVSSSPMLRQWLRLYPRLTGFFKDAAAKTMERLRKIEQ